MQYLPNFKFKVNLSAVPYKSKPEAEAAQTSRKKDRAEKYKHVKTCCYFEHTLTGQELLNKISEGYIHANIHNRFLTEEVVTDTGRKYRRFATSRSKWNKGALNRWARRKDTFLSTNCISVDIDETKYKDIKQYIRKLHFEPSLVYTTGSDTPEMRRFRIVYIFETPITKGEYFERYAGIIALMIKFSTNERIKDPTWIRDYSRHFFGSCNPNFTYNSGKVYNFVDFEKYYESIGAETAVLFGDTNSPVIPEIIFDPMLLLNIQRHGRDKSEFARWCHKYTYIIRNYNDLRNELCPGEFANVDDYMVLDKPKLVEVGERAKVLKKRAALRRIMTQGRITPDELLFNLWMDKLLICEWPGMITDKPLEMEIVKDINLAEAKDLVKYILSFSVNELKVKYRKEVKRCTHKFITGNGTTNKDIQKIISNMRKDYIKENYKAELTVKENCKLMGVSAETLTTWLKENKLDKQTKI